jgi:sporulation inhibitor KapD
MTEFVYGKIIGVDESIRVIALREKRRIRRFYLAKGMFLSFSQYWKAGVYVFLRCQLTVRRYHGVVVHPVVQIEKLMWPNRQQPQLFYDVSMIKSGIRTIINIKKPKLFLDLEMSMPPYRNYQNFISEIIQAGMVLVDDQGQVLEEHTVFIRPTLFPQISDRTIKFLHLTQTEIDGGITYPEFVSLLKTIQQDHRPMVFVWGQNDQLELSRMNERHKIPNFVRHMQLIDLLKLHKTYFGLKNDLGLFNAYNLYSEETLNQQRHDAFQDAMVTKHVFFGFRDVINGKRSVTLPIETNGNREETPHESSKS